MKNPTFFLVPDIDAAKTIMAHIRELGVDESDLHVVANEDITLEPCPNLSKDQ